MDLTDDDSYEWIEQVERAELAEARLRELEMQLENCRLDAEGVAFYIQEANRAEAKLRELEEFIEQILSEYNATPDEWDHFDAIKAAKEG